MPNTDCNVIDLNSLYDSVPLKHAGSNSVQMAKLFIEAQEEFYSDNASYVPLPSFVASAPSSADPSTVCHCWGDDSNQSLQIQDFQNIHIQFNKCPGIVLSPIAVHSQYVCYSVQTESPMFGRCVEQSLCLAILGKNGERVSFSITSAIGRHHMESRWICIVPLCGNFKVYLQVSPASWLDIAYSNVKCLSKWICCKQELEGLTFSISGQVVDRIFIVYNEKHYLSNGSESTG